MPSFSQSVRPSQDPVRPVFRKPVPQVLSGSTEGERAGSLSWNRSMVSNIDGRWPVTSMEGTFGNTGRPATGKGIQGREKKTQHKGEA